MLTRASLRIAVIGAGLAGASVTRAAARAGFGVDLFEAHDGFAQGASGNPIGIYHPLISRDYNLASQLIDQGIAKTRAWIAELIADGRIDDPSLLHHVCGVLQIARTKEEHLDWQKITTQFGFDPDWLSYLGANESRAKVYLNKQLTDDASIFAHGGLWSANSGWISPPRFVDAMLSDARAHGAEISFGACVRAISKDGVISFESGQTQKFDYVVVCSGHTLSECFPNAELGISPIAGNLDIYDLTNTKASENILGLAPHSILCADGYLTPIVNGTFSVGATFDRPDSEDPISNKKRLSLIAPLLAEAATDCSIKVRRSYRSATIDRMPHIGRIFDDSSPLALSISQLHQMPRAQNLWVVGGFGSRGLSLAPLAAELLVALIKGEEPGLDQALMRAVDPVRFALRRHQRNPVREIALRRAP